MKNEIHGISDVEALGRRWEIADDVTNGAKGSRQPKSNLGQPEHSSQGQRRVQLPQVLSADELMALDLPKPGMLIEDLLPSRGACLLFGAPKSNKTLLAIQMAIAVASGKALFDYYRVLEPGPVLVIEQDDPAGQASIKDILERSPVPVKGIPFFLSPRLPFTFGPGLIDWLNKEIADRKLRLVVLDSYTALRAPRGSSVDIVKAEQSELEMMDSLAKDTGCTATVVHHDSKGSSGLDWSQKAAGTFAMSAATEVQMHISRFADLASNAPERLLRVRGRHIDGKEMVLRFRKESLDHEHILEGGAAPLYPLLLQIRNAFGAQVFSPKDLVLSTGVSRSTANRHIDRLHEAGALTKRGFGEYFMNARL